MRQSLRDLLRHLHPQHTLDETARRADEAVNSFAQRSSRIADWEQFCMCVIRFGRHVDTRILRLRGSPNMDPEFAWGHYARVLQQAYGPHGEKAAFEMARTGVEGGLNSVLRKFAEIQALQYAQNEIQARISQFWNGLSPADQLAVTDEYLMEYGHLLPSELTEQSAARLRANFPRVLAEHPRLMQRLGRVGRS